MNEFLTQIPREEAIEFDRTNEGDRIVTNQENLRGRDGVTELTPWVKEGVFPGVPVSDGAEIGTTQEEKEGEE